MKKITSAILLTTSTLVATSLAFMIPSVFSSLNQKSIISENLNKSNFEKSIIKNIHMNDSKIVFDQTFTRPPDSWNHEFTWSVSESSIQSNVYRALSAAGDNPRAVFDVETTPITFNFNQIKNNIIGNYENSYAKYDEINYELINFINVFNWDYVGDKWDNKGYVWGDGKNELISSSKIFGKNAAIDEELYANTAKESKSINHLAYETQLFSNILFDNSNHNLKLRFESSNAVQSRYVGKTARFKININQAQKPVIKYTLPYSDIDRIEFNDIFNKIFQRKKFVFYSDSLVGFPSSDLNNDANNNEKKILEEIDKRINDFFNDSRIKNSKLGSILRGVTSEINYNSSEAIDKKEKLEVKINFQLLNGDKFTFDGTKPESSLETTMSIQIKPNQYTKYPVNELVQIKPYEISSQGNGTFAKAWTGDKGNIVIKPPEDEYISDFKLNLNKINAKGVRNLIPFEKMSIVRKYGAKINVKLGIKIANEPKPIEFDLNFDSIYGNGRIIISKTIKPIKLSNGDTLSFNDNNKIDFSLNVKENDIFLEFATPPKIVLSSHPSENNKEISLSILSGEAIIPKDQVVVESKWKTLDAAKTEDENDFTDAGTYWTEDPFTFKLTNTTIPINQEGVTTFDSRFKPYIGGEALGLSGTGAGEDGTNDYFYADLGQYIMGQKEENGTVNVEIVVKEFVPANSRTGADSYTKEVWKIVIKVDKISSSSSFLLSGWNSNQIDPIEKEKFFDKEKYPDIFRGDIVSAETGMYIPKIAWVNSPPPEGFTFDPLDENGEIIAGDNETKNYDVGYIAQINATGFLNNEFKSMPTIGGYETIFDPKEYVPTGLYPYSEYYTYGKNGIIPIIERVPLIDSGALSNKKELKQTVLKRNNNYSFLYQFSLISSEIEKNIFDLYSQYEGDNNKPLFVDFWTTNQGKHLTNYLVSKGILKSIDEVLTLEYFNVVQYWNIYVNDPIHYNSPTNPGIDNNYGIDISQWGIPIKLLKINALDALGISIRKYIHDSINSLIKNEEIYVEPGYLITEGIDYKIEVDDSQFNIKLKTLLGQYDLPISQTKIVEFKVISLNKKDDTNYIKNSTIIKFRNNKNIDDILDLTNLSSSTIIVNTNNKDFFPDGIDKTTLIRETIYTSVNNEINKFLKENNSNANIDLKLDKHYKIEFYSKKYNSQTGQIDNFYYRNINEAINFCLLNIEDEMQFDNTLFLNVKAIDSDENYFIYGSYSKKVNNSDKNKGLGEYSKINFNNFIVNDIKVNTEDEFFPIEPGNTNYTEQKIKIMSDLIYKRIQNDIDFYSREQYFQTDKKISRNIHYKLEFSKKDAIGNIVKYMDITEAITLGLLNDLANPKFDNTIIVDVIAINPNPDELIEGKFTKIVNNSYLNQGIEIDPGVPGEEQPDNATPPTLDDNLLEDGEKNTSNSEILWWTITPIVFLIAATGIIITIIKVKKKHQIY